MTTDALSTPPEFRPHPNDEMWRNQVAFARARKNPDGVIVPDESIGTEWLPEAAEMFYAGEYTTDGMSKYDKELADAYIVEGPKRMELGQPATEHEATELILKAMLEYGQYSTEASTALFKFGDMLSDKHYDNVLLGVELQRRNAAKKRYVATSPAEAKAYSLNSSSHTLEQVNGALGPHLVSRRIANQSETGQIDPGSNLFSSESDLRRVMLESPEILEPGRGKRIIRSAKTMLNAAGVWYVNAMLPRAYTRRKFAQSGNKEDVIDGTEEVRDSEDVWRMLGEQEPDGSHLDEISRIHAGEELFGLQFVEPEEDQRLSPQERRIRRAAGVAAGLIFMGGIVTLELAALRHGGSPAGTAHIIGLSQR